MEINKIASSFSTNMIFNNTETQSEKAAAQNTNKIDLNNIDEEEVYNEEEKDSKELQEEIKSQETKQNKILQEKEYYQNEMKKLEEEIEEKTQKYEELLKEAKKNGEETETSEMKNLKSDIDDLKTKLTTLSLNVEVLTKKYNSGVENLSELKKDYEEALKKEKNDSLESSSKSASSQTNDGIDWNKLIIEGKGVNIANLAKVLACASEACGSTSATKVVDYIYKNGTEEERNAVKLVFSGLDEYDKENGYQGGGLAGALITSVSDAFDREDVFGDDIGSVVSNLSFLAKFDRDGDGFITSAESTKIVTDGENFSNLITGAFNQALNANADTGDLVTSLAQLNIDTDTNSAHYVQFRYGVSSDGSIGSACYGAAIFQNICQTTVNGQKVYVLSGAKGNKSHIMLSESEFKALDEYYTKNGDKADINGALNAMNATMVSQTQGSNNTGERSSNDDPNETLFDTTVFKSSLGFENTLIASTTNDSNNNVSSQLWYAYRAIKNMDSLGGMQNLQ